MKESHQWIRTTKGAGKKTLARFGLCPGFQAIANWFNFFSLVCLLSSDQWKPVLTEGFFWKRNGELNSSSAFAVHHSKDDKMQQQLPRHKWQLKSPYEQERLSTEQEPEEPYTGWGEQEQRQGKRNRRWTWSKDFLLWEIPDSRTAFQGR